MIITSTLSNFLSNLKNHYILKKNLLKQKKTKQILQIIKLLTKEGFIGGYYCSKNGIIQIFLKYNNNQSVIKDIEQISKPGKRVYIKNKWLYNYKNNKFNFYILSTNKGYLTNRKAQQLNLGGELICRII